VDENDDISIIKNGEIIESGLAKDIVNKHNKENLVDTFSELTKALK
jgi:ABC-type Na+ transport system ATPase subunit NatA